MSDLFKALQCKFALWRPRVATGDIRHDMHTEHKQDAGGWTGTTLHIIPPEPIILCLDMFVSVHGFTV